MSALTLCILPAVWLVWAIAAPVKVGRKAQHTLWGITLPADAGFVAVQERGEWRLSKLLAVLTGVMFPLPFALGFTLDPPQMMLFAYIAQAGLMIAVDNGTRGMNAVDYAGHEAEILAAERAGVEGYREAETARMEANDRDKRGQDVAAGLARMRWLARVVLVLGRLL